MQTDIIRLQGFNNLVEFNCMAGPFKQQRNVMSEVVTHCLNHRQLRWVSNLYSRGVKNWPNNWTILPNDLHSSTIYLAYPFEELWTELWTTNGERSVMMFPYSNECIWIHVLHLQVVARGAQSPMPVIHIAYSPSHFSKIYKFPYFHPFPFLLCPTLTMIACTHHALHVLDANGGCKQHHKHQILTCINHYRREGC